jgi:hypothetical protein
MLAAETGQLTSEKDKQNGQEQPKETPTKSSEEVEDASIYELKKIKYFGRTVPIILQNVNGPCPLIAVGKSKSGINESLGAILKAIPFR